MTYPIDSWFNMLTKIDAQSGIRAFVIRDVTYDTYDEEAEVQQNQVELNLPTYMVADAEDLELEDSDNTDDIREKIADWISDETGWLVENFSYHIVDMSDVESQNE